MKRIFLSVILIAAIMVVGTGCEHDDKPKQSVNEMALEFLEQKYGEKFEYSAPAGSSYSGTRTFLATCESFGDRRVLVQVENFRDSENSVVLDNYIAIKYEDKVIETFKKAADEEFGTSRIFYTASGRVLSSELPSDASFEEYLDCKDGLINPYIILPESSHKSVEQLKSLSDKISNTFSVDSLSVSLLVLDDDTFKSADEKKVQDILIRNSGVAQLHISRHNGKTDIEIKADDYEPTESEATSTGDIWDALTISRIS